MFSVKKLVFWLALLLVTLLPNVVARPALAQEGVVEEGVKEEVVVGEEQEKLYVEADLGPIVVPAEPVGHDVSEVVSEDWLDDAYEISEQAGCNSQAYDDWRPNCHMRYNPTVRIVYVVGIQWILACHGYLPTSGVDGYFGTQTHNAVVRFQRDHGLTPNPPGVVGDGNWRELRKHLFRTRSDATYHYYRVHGCNPATELFHQNRSSNRFGVYMLFRGYRRFNTDIFQ